MFKRRVPVDREGSERLVRELLANGGTRARATVLSIRRQSMVHQTTFKGPEKFRKSELRVRVEPSNGAPFETTFSQVFDASLERRLELAPAGFDVIYDPADPDRIAIDVINSHETLRREDAPETTEFRALADEFQRTGGVAGHLDRLRSVAANPPARDPDAELERLGQLRASGALSDEQFAIAKAEVLSRL